MTYILSWGIGYLYYVVREYLANFSPDVTWTTGFVSTKAAMSGQMAGNPDFFLFFFLVYDDYFLAFSAIMSW